MRRGEAKPESLLEAAPAMLSVDQAGGIRYANRLVELLFGFDRDKLIGQPVEMLMPESFPLIHTENLARYAADAASRPSGASVALTARHQDGSEFPIDVNMSHVDTGDVLLVITATHVASGQQALEGAALATAIVEYADDAIIGSRLDGTITSWNPGAERMYGYRRSEIIGRSGRVLTPRGRAAESAAVLARVGAAQDVERLETERVRKDGTVVPVSITVAPIRDSDGVVVGAAMTHRDVTEQRQAFETALRMAAIIEDSDDAIVSASLDGIMTSWNPAAARMYGFSSQEIIGRSAEVLVAEDETDIVRAVLERTAAGEHVEALETNCRRKDGVVFPITVTVSPIRDADGAIVGASAIARDVTEQRRGFEAGQLAAIVQGSGEAILSGSLDGVIQSWNPAAERMFGYSREEMVGSSAASIIAEDVLRDLQASLTKVNAGQHIENLETSHIRKDGTVIPISLTISPIHDARGAVIGASLIARDLSGQIHAAQYARSLIEAGLDPLVSISPDGLVTDVNEATIKVTGVPRAELIGTEFFEYFTETEKAKRIYRQALAEGMAVDCPLTMRHTDGTLTEVRYNASVYRDAEGKVLGVFAVARDVTKQMQAQREIAEQQVKALDKVVELEAFQRLTVGRELKMIDLKKEIEFLRRHVAD